MGKIIAVKMNHEKPFVILKNCRKRKPLSLLQHPETPNYNPNEPKTATKTSTPTPMCEERDK